MIKTLFALAALLLAPCARAAGTVVAVSPVRYYEPVPSVETGAPMIRVSAQLKVKPAFDPAGQARPLQQPCEVLRERYGFVLDDAFAPQALPNEKEFSILPYPAEPRPLVFFVKGFVAQARLREFGQDPLVRQVSEERQPNLAPNRELLVQFVQTFGGMITAVKGVASIAVGGQDKPLLVIVLDGASPEKAVKEAVEAKLPGFSDLPHRYDAPAPAAKPEPRYRTRR